MTIQRTRWGLAAVLLLAALVNGYLALSESVLWPAILAVIWIGLAAALITPEPKPHPVDLPRPRAPQSPTTRSVPV